MSLDLDDRQRAMLREMGVHVWQPVADVAVDLDVAVTPERIATNSIDTRVIGENVLKSADADPSTTLAPALAPPATPDTLAASPSTATPASAVPVPAAPSPAPARRPPTLAAPVAGPTTVKDLPEGIASLAWPQLADAVAHCQACAMCFGRRAPVLAALDEATPCDWLVVGDPPDEPQERMGLPFVEEAGALLDNMLRAVGVQRFVPEAVSVAGPAQSAYLTHVLKCRPALMRAPDATELATCANYLRREIALTQPKVILAMGRFAMQVLLSETPSESAKLPLGKLRGQVWQFAGVPVVVTYPPSYLLRSGQDKGKAWADLCLALDVAQGKL